VIPGGCCPGPRTGSRPAPALPTAAPRSPPCCGPCLHTAWRQGVRNCLPARRLSQAAGASSWMIKLWPGGGTAPTAQGMFVCPHRQHVSRQSTRRAPWSAARAKRQTAGPMLARPCIILRVSVLSTPHSPTICRQQHAEGQHRCTENMGAAAAASPGKPGCRQPSNGNHSNAHAQNTMLLGWHANWHAKHKSCAAQRRPLAIVSGFKRRTLSP